MEQVKPKVYKKQEIIKISTEINEIENTNNREDQCN